MKIIESYQLVNQVILLCYTSKNKKKRLQGTCRLPLHNSIFDYQGGQEDEEDFTRSWRNSCSGGMW